MIFDGYIPGMEPLEPEEPADEFVQLQGPDVMRALVHVASILTRRYGDQVDISKGDMDAVAGWALRLLYNPKTGVIRTVVDGAGAAPVWDKATPGVEPGHA